MTYNQNYYRLLERFEETKNWQDSLTFALTKSKPHIQTNAKVRVLDVGCGLGRSKILVEKQFPDCEYFGLERSFVPFNQSGATELECVVSDAHTLPFREQSFDIVLMLHVIAHLQDVKLSLTKVWDLLRQNGLLIIITPNKVFVNSVLKLLEKISFRSLCDKTIISNFSKSEIKRLAAETGFNTVYLCYLQFELLSSAGLTTKFSPLGGNILLIGQKTNNQRFKGGN